MIFMSHRVARVSYDTVRHENHLSREYSLNGHLEKVILSIFGLSNFLWVGIFLMWGRFEIGLTRVFFICTMFLTRLYLYIFVSAEIYA
jgi:hypothetical protein